MTDLPKLKQGLALGLFSKGLFYIRAMDESLESGGEKTICFGFELEFEFIVKL